MKRSTCWLGIGALAAVSMALCGLAPQTTTAQNPGRYSASSEVTHYNELSAQLSAFYRRAAAQHVTVLPSDQAAVETILKERIKLTSGNVADHYALAVFYDDIGRYADALGEWKSASAPRRGSSASFLHEPSVLARFGDLALRERDRRLAANIYGEAAAPMLKSGEVKVAELATDNLQAMRAAAHYAAAESKISHGLLAEALEDYKICTPLMQKSQNARLGYGRLLARLGHSKEAKAEFRSAELMAPDARSKSDIHLERLRLGLIETRSVTVIKDGKATNHVEELPDKG